MLTLRQNIILIRGDFQSVPALSLPLAVTACLHSARLVAPQKVHPPGAPQKDL